MLQQIKHGIQTTKKTNIAKTFITSQFCNFANDFAIPNKLTIISIVNLQW